MDLHPRSQVSRTPGRTSRRTPAGARTLAKKATVLALAAALASTGTVFTATRAEAAASPTWDCSTPLIFVAQGNPTQLETEQFTGAAGAGAFTPVGTNTVLKYNSIGFDPIDDYLYGVGKNKGVDLLRIDSTGGITDVGDVPNFNGENGAFDPQGNFYLGDKDTLQLTRIAANVVTSASTTTTAGTDLPTTTITLSQAITTSDFTYDYGFLWGAGPDGTIQRIDPVSGTVTYGARPTLANTTVAYGADWTYGDGSLGFSDNAQGNISRVQIINPTGAFSFGPVDVTAGPTSGNNDGASCSEPTDLGVTKTVNSIPLAGNSATAPDLITPGSAISWQINGVNNGPGGSSQQFITDTLPAGITNITVTPSAGGTCTTATAGAAFTCKYGYLANGGTRSITITATATTTVNTSQNNLVTISGDEQDSNPNNNSYTAYASTYNPAISLVKNAGPVVDANNDGRVDAGDTVAYTFAVTNTGNVTVSTVGVTDPLVGTVTCPLTTLTPNQSTTCTAAAYTLTQTDLDNGSVSNTATASGTPPGSTTPITSTSTKKIALTQAPSMSLVKHAGAIVDANGDGRADAGDTIAYTFTVTNTGTVTLGSVGVTDNLAGAVTCPSASLAPNAQETCAANNPYTLTQSDVDNGSAKNTATASGTPPGAPPISSPPSSTTTTIPAAPSLGLVKHAGAVVDANGDGRIDAGDTIAYTFTLTNTGNLSLTSLAVSDPLAGAVTCPAVTLTPGQSTTCTANNAYPIALADMNAGSVSNTATASGTTTVSKSFVPSGPSSTTTPLPATPALAMTKNAGAIVDANGDGRTDAGDTIAYTFLVTNTGTVTMSGIAISDPLVTGVSCPNASLDPGASETCTAPAYTLTQADADAGSVSNTATATGTPPSSTTVTSSPPSMVVTTVPPSPSISVVKTGTVTPSADQNALAVGDTIAYTFVARNTGTVTLTAVSVADSMTDVGAVTCQATTLAPGQSTSCAAATPHTVTQADVDAGTVANTATVSAQPPTGDTVTGDDTITLNAQPPAPAMTLVKTATVTPAADQNAYQVGDVIGYTFLVTNTGNLTLSAVGVTDPTIGAVTCPTATLAPNTSETCTADATHTVTQAEFDAQQPLINTATSTGTPPRGGAPVTGTSTATTPPAPAVPGLSIVKSATVTPSSDQDAYEVDDTVDYSFLVTNTGNVTMTGVAVDDADPSVGAVTCPVTTLAPGAATTCTTVDSYTVTQADVDAGTIVNTATATGTPPASTGITTYTSGSSTKTLIAVPADPALTIVKSATVTPAADQTALQVGDTIAYSFLVTNTGNVTLTGVVVNDKTAGSVTCPATTLAPGTSTTCTADNPRTVTQADFDALQPLVNTATATGTPPQGLPDVPSDPSTVTLPLAPPVAAIGFVKKAVVTPAADQAAIKVGDTIAYSFEVTNTGNVTETVTKITDPVAGPVTCPVATLAPGVSETCTADKPYVVTQADFDNGSRANTAQVFYTPVPGVPVNPPGSSTVTVPAGPAHPALALVKSATVNPAADAAGVKVGDTISYSFLVTNTGDVTMTGVSVSDVDPAVGPVTCPVTTLAPGASTTCVATNSHTVTQAELDSGQALVNVATALGTPPRNLPVTPSPSSTVTVPLATATPGLKLVKAARVTPSADQNDVRAGDTIIYAFTVTNTGNVTMNNVGVSDPTGSAVTCPKPTLAPGQSEICLSRDKHTVTAAEVANATYLIDSATAHGTPTVGIKVDSLRVTVKTPVRKPQPAPDPPALPLAFTGADVRTLLMVGLTSLLLGLSLVGLARRRA